MFMFNFFKKTVMLALATSIAVIAAAQDGYWTKVATSSGITKDKGVLRATFPKEFKLFSLELASIKQKLFSIAGKSSSTTITLPDAEGNMENFEVWEASNFESSLQARFKEIRAFSGRSTSNTGATLKISIAPSGIQTMVFRANGKPNEYIEPFSADHKIYAVFTSQRNKGGAPWLCSTPDEKLAKGLTNAVNRAGASTGELKTMRLAQSVTAEYSNFFGATSASQVALVLAAVNATMTRTNGCYERDLALHLNLIANTTNVFYYDAATDPYSPGGTGAGGAWTNELQNTLTAVIGEANYDVGHLFGASGGGGNAGCIGCVCVDGQKGKGYTSPGIGGPTGDDFDIDYVAHEIGHQLGANHTFSVGNEGTGVNKEVGSGITIMGYAGITAVDVAPHSIDIFHAASIAQVQANLANKTCPVTTSLAGINATPVVAPIANVTIPPSTPFTLTGTATDANASDILTYCWEQDDNTTTTGAASVASPTKTTGPNWLSFPARTSGSKSFPVLATVLAGNSVTGPLPGGDPGANIEALSSVSRALKFRLTVRDNRPYNSATGAVGQTSFQDMTVNVDATNFTPFLITSQNTAATYVAGSTQTVTWSVGNTTAAPISVANVKILFSSNGGNTFSTLVASTPNDGTETIQIPGVSGTSNNCRIKVESIGSVIFDINNAPITVTMPADAFGFNPVTPVTATCPVPASMLATITAAFTGTYTGPVTLAASGNPAGTTVVFGSPTLTAANPSTTVTLTGTGALPFSSYTIVVTGTGTGVPPVNADVVYTISAGATPAFTAQPANTTGCVGGTANYSVTATNAASYQWQVSTNNGGTWTNIAGATTAAYSFTIAAADNGKQFRCVVANTCNISATSAVATFNLVSAGTLAPATTVVCGPVNSTTLTLNGAIGTIVRWEVSTDGGATFTNIANTTTTLTAVNIAQNRIYRVLIQGAGCAPTYSATSTLTYSASAVGNIGITAFQGTTLCQGDPTLLTAVGLNTNSLSSTGAISIPSSGTATPYPSTIAVSGLPTSGVSVRSVTLNGFSHTFPDDVDIVLRSPSGVNVILMSDVGGGSAVTNANYTFRDGAASLMADAALNASGTYRPTNYVTPDNFVAPGPGSLTQATPLLSSFTGDVNGTWSLYVVDDLGGDLGTITNFSIEFASAVPLGGGFTFAWTPATGLNNTATNPVAASPAVSTVYSVTVTNAAGCTGTATVPITVNTRPAITNQPLPVDACVGSTANFNVSATGTGVTYQWQLSTDNCATYTNIVGATASTLSLANVTAAQNNNSYRCIVSGTCPTPVNSNCVKLTVNALPTVTVTPDVTCGGIQGINGVLLTTGGQASPPPIPGTRTFTSNTPVSIPDNNVAGATSVLNVAGIPANATVTAMSIKFNLSHTYLGDIVMALKAPNGNVLNLNYYLSATAVAGGGVGYVNTVISSAGTALLSSGSGTYTGTFRPDAAGFASNPPMAPTGFTTAGTTVGSFANLYSLLNGNYTLGIYDGFTGDVGILSNWSITIDYTVPDPATPPITYTWSPAAGLFTNATATTPYVAGTLTPSVYAAPTTFTSYTVTANTTATGCKNSATALVNYTPPAPSITPNPAVKCSTDAPLKLRITPSNTLNFNSGAISIAVPDNTANGVSTTLNVAGIPAGATITGVRVTLNMPHTYIGDMIFNLKAPNGNILALDKYLSSTGAAGANFTNTVISSTGTTALGAGLAPFTGTFRADATTTIPAAFTIVDPAGFVANVTNWTSLYSVPNGTWTLAMADGGPADLGTLTNWQLSITYLEGVPALPPVWSPVGGLFSNAAGTVPYVAGTAVDSVWANPAATSTYSATVTGFAGPAGPSQPIASNLAMNNGNGLVTFNFTNSNTYPVVITDIASVFFFSGTNGTTAAYYKPSAINGAPGAISAANGWLPAGSGTVAAFTAGTVQPFVRGMSLTIPAGATYGIAVEASDALGANIGYNGTGAGPALTTVTAGGCSIITGPNIGYGGGLAPAAPTFTVRAFIGTISFARAAQCTSPERTFTVTVNTPIAVTQPPATVTVCDKANTAITAAATGTVQSHNWQLSTNNGVTYTDLANNATYGGVKTATLAITNAQLTMNGYLYRDSLAAVACARVITIPTRLIVNPLPVVTISAAPLTRLYPGLRTTLTASSNPAANPATGFRWFRNGVLVSGATANTLVVDIDRLGDYTATSIDQNGCGSGSPSNLVTIGDSLNSRVFIYPNPNAGQFQVRYYSTLNNTNLPRGINIYDARGKRVHIQAYRINTPYERMDVDLARFATGVYTVEVVDVNNERLAIGRVTVIR
jgi:subtilisin-like proprotein convertase family protein